jgi:hypothetical protein
MISGGKRWRRYGDFIGRLSPTALNLTMPTALFGKRQESFRAAGSQPVGGVIEKIKSDPARVG